MRAATPAARQKRSDKLIKNDHNETGPLVRATHVHYVSVSAGLWLEYIKGFWIEEGVGGGVAGGRRSASSQTDDPADRLTFCGGFNSWGGRRQRSGPAGGRAETTGRDEGRIRGGEI